MFKQAAFLNHLVYIRLGYEMRKEASPSLVQLRVSQWTRKWPISSQAVVIVSRTHFSNTNSMADSVNCCPTAKLFTNCEEIFPFGNMRFLRQSQ